MAAPGDGGCQIGMTPERWRQIRAIFDLAVECAPPRRERFIRERCGNDAELQREVESLLASDREAGSLLDNPIPLAPPEARAALRGELDPELCLEVESLPERNDLSGLKDGSALGDLLEDSTVTGLAVGTRLGPYEIEKLLGAGGMGKVYRAVDTRIPRKVAIKVCAERFSDRFERESRAIGSLNHPHICALYDVGPNYLVMELLEGETLASRLRRGCLPVEQALRFGVEIADALAETHGCDIIHRDIKPGNIMITPKGVKVLDFGLAKRASPGGDPLTGSRAVMGTPGYMAPEQEEGAPCDARTDIYSLGLVLHEMLTGRRTFDVAGQTSPITLPALDRVVRKCLAQDLGSAGNRLRTFVTNLKGFRK